ncbi:condensation protein [Streptomyces sp. NPDC021098]|uniref:condensation protein n=1 Tax=unclassified Streptomyces TaxID=2593676 RepID=UPI00379BA565
MTAVERGAGGHSAPATAAPHRARRIPFPTVDEISRHCFQDDEPETVHIEVHLPGRPEPERLRDAFRHALSRHPRILVREAPGRWWRRRYEWEVTDGPDVEPVSFPPCAPGALTRARERALAECPPLTASPPVRMEVVTEPDRTGCVLVLTVNHTALDGPSCLRVFATAAALYSGGGGGGATPAAPPAAPPPPAPPAPPAAVPGRGLARPVRIAMDTHTPRTGNAMSLFELPVPQRTPGAPGDGPRPTVNDQLLVATCLMAARWNALHDRPPTPVRITMPVDDRPRGASGMAIGNGTRLVEVGFGPEERADAELLTRETPDPAAVARLLHRTAARTRALKAAPGAQLGVGGTLLTVPAVPVGLRAAVTRGLRRAAGPWTSTTLLSNIGRIPYTFDFGEAGEATAVWVSAPARMPRGLTVTTASTGGRLHVTVRWSRALLDDAAGAGLAGLFQRALAATTQATAQAHTEGTA